METWILMDFTGSKPIGKMTPQGQLDQIWTFPNEDEGRAAAVKLGYCEPMKYRFIPAKAKPLPNLPIYLKLMEQPCQKTT